MADINHKITINASKDKVYQAVATVDDLKNWWTGHIIGESAEGKSLTFCFPETGPVMEVLELMDNELVKWKCVDGVDDWKDTILTFEMDEKDEGCELLFAQSGWSYQSEFYAHCSMKWAVFLLSLKEYCETGKGHPFPDDIKV